MITYVINEYGKAIDYELAVIHMDDELREELSRKLAPCSEQEFFDAYANLHRSKFGEEWIANMENPCW